MFGSDWPVCTLAATYEAVVAAAEELTAVLSGPERDGDLRLAPLVGPIRWREQKERA